MAKWLAKEFDWDTGKYTGNYYDIAQAGIVAVFVDSFFGLDTNAGTAAAPFKTLGKAITTLNATGANGSRIYMNGIFSETLPAKTYWYDFIGCGGGWQEKVIFWSNNSTGQRIVPNTAGMRVSNFITMNYDGNNFISQGSSGHIMYFLNGIIQNANLNNTILLGRQQYMYKCILKNISFTRSISSSRAGVYAYDSILYDFYHNQSTTVTEIIGSNNYLKIDYDKTMTSIIDSTTMSIKDIEAQFLNINNNDFNVRITSPLLGAGTIDEITGQAKNVGDAIFGLPYNGLILEFTTAGGATITDLTIDATGKYTITAPATSGTLETALMDLGNIYPLENIDLFNVFDFLSGEITQGVFEDFVSPRMALTIKLKYGLTAAEVDACPWLLIEYGKQPTFSGTGASRVGNAADTFDPDTFQEITCRYMKLFITLQNNS